MKNLRLFTRRIVLFGYNIPVRKLLKYAFVGFYFSAITPSSTGGQPMQMYFMKKDGISVSHSSLGLLIMLMMFQIVSIVYGILMFVLRPSLIIDGINGMHLVMMYGIIANLIITGTILGAVFSRNAMRRFVCWGIGLGAKLRLVKNPEKAIAQAGESLDNFRTGARYIKAHPILLLKVLCTSTLQITAQFAVPYFVYLALGLSGHGIIDVLAIQSWLMISVSSLPLPGAVGAAESCFMKLSYSLFGDAIPAAMLLSRGISFYFYLIVGGIVSSVSYFRSAARGSEIKELS